jgi:hypothetical protein
MCDMCIIDFLIFIFTLDLVTLTREVGGKLLSTRTLINERLLNRALVMSEQDSLLQVPVRCESNESNLHKSICRSGECVNWSFDVAVLHPSRPPRV